MRDAVAAMVWLPGFDGPMTAEAELWPAWGGLPRGLIALAPDEQRALAMECRIEPRIRIDLPGGSFLGKITGWIEDCRPTFDGSVRHARFVTSERLPDCLIPEDSA